MEPDEALHDAAENASNVVETTLGDRPPEVAGVAEVGPVARMVSEVLRCAANDLSSSSGGGMVFEGEAEAAGFVIRDIRRFSTLVDQAVSKSLEGVRASAPSSGSEVDDAVRKWVIAGIALAVARYASELETRAGTDTKTGLRRRDAFEDELGKLVRKGNPFSLVFADLDDLKKYNTEGGYAAGDRAIVLLSERLVGTIGDSGTVFRWGGDEFVALLPGAVPEDVEAMILGLREAEEPRFSFGLAHFPLEANDASQLWRTAEDRAKRDKGLRKMEGSIQQGSGSGEEGQ